MDSFMDVHFLSSPTSTHTTGSMFKPTSCRASITVMLICRQEREARGEPREPGSPSSWSRAQEQGANTGLGFQCERLDPGLFPH